MSYFPSGDGPRHTNATVWIRSMSHLPNQTDSMNHWSSVSSVESIYVSHINCLHWSWYSKNASTYCHGSDTLARALLEDRPPRPELSLASSVASEPGAASAKLATYISPEINLNITQLTAINTFYIRSWINTNNVVCELHTILRFIRLLFLSVASCPVTAQQGKKSKGKYLRPCSGMPGTITTVPS